MKIDWKHLIAPAIALVLVALAVSAYVAEREDRIRAEVTTSVKQQGIDARDKAVADLVATFKDAAAKITRPEQVGPALPQVIELKTPIVQVPEVKHESHGSLESHDAQLPIAASAVTAQPGDLIIRKAATVEFYQKEAVCKQNAALLGACRDDLKDTKVQRDTAISAVKGGTFFTRLKRNAKWFAIGGAVGAGGILATRR